MSSTRNNLKLLMRLPDVLELTGLCRTSIYTMVKEKRFPSPILIGERAMAWLGDDISEWIEEKKKSKENHEER